MINRTGLISFLIVSVTLLFSCTYFTDSLTDKDIQQYTQAYNNIAKISPQLEEEKKKSNSITVLTCKACLGLLKQAVQEAGYSDLQTFLVMDIRIHLALRHLFYLRVTKLIGEVASDIPVESLCRDPDKRTDLSEQDRKKLTTQCQNIRTLDSYIEKAGAIVLIAAEKLLSKGDIATVEKNIDAIIKALNNEALVDDFRHGGGEFDD